MKLFKKTKSLENVLDEAEGVTTCTKDDNKSFRTLQPKNKSKRLKKCDIGTPKDFVKLSPEYLPHFSSSRCKDLVAEIEAESKLKSTIDLEQVESKIIQHQAVIEIIPKSPKNVAKKQNNCHNSLKRSPEYLPHFRKSDTSTSEIEQEVISKSRSLEDIRVDQTNMHPEKIIKKPCSRSKNGIQKSHSSNTVDRFLVKSSKCKNKKHDISYLKISSEALPHFRTKSSQSIIELIEGKDKDDFKTQSSSEVDNDEVARESNIESDVDLDNISFSNDFIPASKILSSYLARLPLPLHSVDGTKSNNHVVSSPSNHINTTSSQSQISSPSPFSTIPRFPVPISTTTRSIDCIDSMVATPFCNRQQVGLPLPDSVPPNVQNDTPINIKIMFHAANQMSSKSRTRKVGRTESVVHRTLCLV